jgi:hypothetical protein
VIVSGFFIHIGTHSCNKAFTIPHLSMPFANTFANKAGVNFSEIVKSLKASFIKLIGIDKGASFLVSKTKFHDLLQINAIVSSFLVKNNPFVKIFITFSIMF